MLKLSQLQTFGLDLKVKAFFRDSRSIIGETKGNKIIRALIRIGGGIRLTSRRSQRSAGKKGKSAAPGEPPRYHGSSDAFNSLRNINFYVDREDENLSVGPVLLNGKAFRKVAAIQEFGLENEIKEKLVGSEWKPILRPARPGQPTRRRIVKYPQRSFMDSALKKYTPRIPDDLQATTRG